MTITYTGKVANARVGAFSRLLFYWRGSIYKLMYKEVIIFCVIYAILSITYRFFLVDWQKRLFENFALHCETFTNLIPVSFVLGFYVAIVVARWWNQFLCIPWPDRVMLYITTMLDGQDDRGRMIRRTVMRYLSLSSLIVLQATSVSVKKRFPTMDHLLEAGVITMSEMKALDEVQTPHGKWWIPILWACNLVKDARKEGRVSDDYLLKAMIDEINMYRGNLGMLYSYDWISIPLVYTQVTTLAVYTFFAGCIFGRQFLDTSQGYPGHNIDFYVPVFTILQFFFYAGWLKVAEQLINPFGEDDDDFDINWILDRNMQISLLAADDLHGSYPILEKDLFYGEAPPDCLPYTKSSISSIGKPFMGSTADVSVSSDGMKIVNPMDTIQEGVIVSDSRHCHQLTPMFGSPTSSPVRPRRMYHNLINATRTPLSISKSSLIEGIRTGSCDKNEAKALIQTLNGPVAVNNATSFVEGWLQAHESRFDLNTNTEKSGQLQARESDQKKDNDSVSIAIEITEPDSNITPSQDHGEDERTWESQGPAGVICHKTEDLSQQANADPFCQQAEKSQKIETRTSNATPFTMEKTVAQSSFDSLPEYEQPDSNQSTVDSMAQLIQNIHR